MPAMYEIEYMPEGRVERFFGSRGNYYEFEDGSRLDMHTTPVWCRQCGDFRHGEEIETIQDIDKRIADLHDPSAFAYQMCFNSLYHETTGKGDEFRRKLVEDLVRRRRWREHRVSLPRCIHCGSTDIVIFRSVNQRPTRPAAAQSRSGPLGCAAPSSTSGSSRPRANASRATPSPPTGTTRDWTTT